jgi:hypothetical protein
VDQEEGGKIVGIHIGIETQYGGFYVTGSLKPLTFRLCLGFFAITVLPVYFDDMLKGYVENEKGEKIDALSGVDQEEGGEY